MFNRTLVFVVIFSAFSATKTPLDAAQLLLNPSFESPAVTSDFEPFIPGMPIEGWFADAEVLIVPSDGSFSLFPAADGDQFIWMTDQAGNGGGAFSQAVALEASTSYLLSFQMLAFAGPQAVDVEVLGGAGFLGGGTFIVESSMDWVTREIEFETSDAGFYLVSVTGDQFNEAFVDDFSLTASVPEPSAFSLFWVTGVGLTLKRKRAKNRIKGG